MRRRPREDPLRAAGAGGGPPVLAKVCGARSARDAAVAADAGADFVGVILSPGFLRSTDPAQAGGIYGAAPPARRVGVFVDSPPGEAAAIARRLALDVIQLSGSEPPGDVRRIAAAGPWQVWKTVHVRSGAPVADLVGPYARVAHGIVLDAWDPSLPGGTGRAFDWAASGRGVRDAFGAATFIAAGGMTPENAGAAIGALQPDVLDVSSGVESAPGSKDPAKVRAFVAAVRRASPAPPHGAPPHASSSPSPAT